MVGCCGCWEGGVFVVGVCGFGMEYDYFVRLWGWGVVVVGRMGFVIMWGVGYVCVGGI